MTGIHDYERHPSTTSNTNTRAICPSLSVDTLYVSGFMFQAVILDPVTGQPPSLFRHK